MTEVAEPDLWLGGRLRLRQPPRGAHRAGTDAVLLARLFEPEPDAVVCDLGAGTGAIGLAYASLHPSCRAVLVERDEALAQLARRNAQANSFEERVTVVEADVLAPEAHRRAAGLPANFADILVTNPPFFDGTRHRPSPNASKAAAHTFAGDGLDAWLRTSAGLLRSGGRLGLIHRADTLPDCLAAMGNRFGNITVRPVQAMAERPAIRVLVSAVKGSRAPFSLLAPLVLQDAAGRFTAEVEAMHRGEAFRP
ncbi:tRNA1(Val) (adenine(37)-N6)-methyltransferase [Methylobacterium haplocladii]|uniref:Methyltransferase n=1 Tax=Methylobacterium haplocladii TaxID=1176176 RepID=A0A512IJC1_9HYPH|nr:methyltransferase [Methylobacterium haplocladii]GEO97784.1 methyltransferase [Methylobacterium haplocladii]GJD82631.1 tRNA1(Val) (adenine(37)-N6)-methyltransferase [Methylobacterium haplocladii]GLS57583.1 methyltransferase [Methylobacterium haplocladii]